MKNNEGFTYRNEKGEFLLRIINRGHFDGALKILDGMRHNGAHRAIDILKGNKDEN